MENTARSGTRHLVTFRLCGDLFALPVEPVGQILPMLAITLLPEGAGALVDSVLGAINLHGTAVPVVDLRRHVGLPCAAIERDTPLVVARASGLAVGLLVDEVIDVLAVDPAAVTPPADLLPHGLGRAPVLAGVVRLPGDASARFALLLDPDHLFAPEQRDALARAVELLHRQPSAAEAAA